MGDARIVKGFFPDRVRNRRQSCRNLFTRSLTVTMKSSTVLYESLAIKIIDIMPPIGVSAAITAQVYNDAF